MSMKPADHPEHLHVVYSGRVQGVGFRHAACSCANGHNVVGQVKNLPDGDVELIAEGMKDALLDLLYDIRNSRVGHNIFNEQIMWKAPVGTFDRFGISFS